MLRMEGDGEDPEGGSVELRKPAVMQLGTSEWLLDALSFDRYIPCICRTEVKIHVGRTQSSEPNRAPGYNAASVQWKNSTSGRTRQSEYRQVPHSTE